MAPPSERLTRLEAAGVMAACGGLAAGAFMLTFEAEVESFALVVPIAALSAAIASAVLIGLARRTAFGPIVAAFGGILTALLAFIPFAVLLMLAMWVDVQDKTNWPKPDPSDLIEGIVLTLALGPVLAAPAILPLGVVGGLICWWIARRRDRPTKGQDGSE